MLIFVFGPVAGRARFFVASAALLTAQSVGAQAGIAVADGAQPAAARLPERGEWSIGAWAGGAPTSYAGHFIGATPGRAIALTGVRFGHAGGTLGPIAVEYVGQLIPAALAYDNPVDPPTPSCGSLRPGNPRRGIQPSIQPGYCNRRVYGAGAMPIGLQLMAPLGTYARLFAAGNAGGLWFAQNVPVPQARRLNFAFDFGGGLEIGTRRIGAVTLGYKLHHISNAWTAPSNPGIDHHVFYLGFIHRLRTAHGALPLARKPAAGADSAAAVRGTGGGQ